VKTKLTKAAKKNSKSPKRPAGYSWLLRLPLTRPSNYEEKLMAIGQATQRGWFRVARRGKLLLTKKLPTTRELVCEEARAAAVALDNAKAEYNNYLWQAQYVGCYWLSTATS
jgi:hypothetical protein